MILRRFRAILLAGTVLSLAACNNEEKKPEPQPEPAAVEVKTSRIKEETVSYTGDGVTMKGFMAIDEAKEGQRPAILIIPEWWGLVEYAKSRARQLAELGYVAFAVDLYGNGKTADNPDSATALSTPFYKNPKMMKARFDAALAQVKTYTQTDTTRIAAIGYCFGGAQALTLAKLGESLRGVVSFHGGLDGGPVPSKNKIIADILVCHGDADPFVPADQVAKFKKQMDSIGVNYTFKAYPDAMHAFTNPAATAAGEKFKIPIKYNAAADTASWKDMNSFLEKIFKGL